MSANRLVHADACAACDLLPADVGFDLVYLDPPFATGSVMSARQGAGQARGRKRRDSGPDAYADPADPDALVAMLVPVFERIRARLRPAATLYVHLDHRAVHEVKVAMDGVFGRGAFQGELIWTPGNGARGKGHVVTHQTLLVYARKPHEEVLYNADDPALREPFAATSLSMHFQKVDEAGRRYRERTIAGKSYRYYADEGRRRGSVWTDLPAMIANTPLRKEGTGYPTQKPEGLLERIVRASSRPGAVVADLMCGSGTTLAVAARLGRSFVGSDRSPVAIATTTARLQAQGVPFERLGFVSE